MIKKKKETAVAVVAIFLVGCVVWFQRALRRYERERLCCCKPSTDELQQQTDGTERIRGGRRRDDGQWFSQTQPFHIHVYSAFFDSRRTLRSEPQVAVIAVLDRRLPRLWCHVWYSNSAVDEAVVLRAYPMPIGAGRLTEDGSDLVEYVVACPVTTDQCAPVSVALAWGASVSELTTFRVPVELAENSSGHHQQHSLAVCVSASFGDVDTRRLVEWLEMQAMLGSELVVIYNHSVSASVSDILSRYAADNDVSVTPRVQLRQTRAFISAADVLLHMSPVINDCMYRFSTQFRYFAVIDLDELIVPRHIYTVPQLIESLSSKNAAPVALFTFRNAYFFLDIPVDDVQHPAHRYAALSTYLVHRRRLTASPPGYSVKSVVSSQACVAMHNHYCWTYAAATLSDWTLRLDVPPHDALLHHYKPCHFDTFLKQPGHCKSAMVATVVDNVINKYSSSLTDRLYARYVQFNLTAVS